jgi:hypothetical protein
MQHEASPISPPYWCPKSHRYAIRIEFQTQEFVLKWDRAGWRPSLSRFPELENGVSIEEVEHSGEEQSIWKRSKLHAYGSYGHVREAISSDGHIFTYKIAHNTPQSRQLIQNEFSILTNLSSQDLPIVRVYEPACKDENGLFGFRMEKLHKISPDRIPHHYEDIERAVHQLHKKNYVHADLTISNIMADDQGQIRLVDFGHAGKLGDPLPHDHPRRVFEKWQAFELDIDLIALDKLRKLICN